MTIGNRRARCRGGGTRHKLDGRTIVPVTGSQCHRFILASCAAPDTRHQIVVSTRDQKLALLDRGNLMATYPVSTSKFGLGDWRGSRFTPLGNLQIAEKIGNNAPPGTVFKSRRRTGDSSWPIRPVVIQSLRGFSGCVDWKRKMLTHFGGTFTSTAHPRNGKSVRPRVTDASECVPVT